MRDIHFFKAGKHTTASGDEISFSDADLSDIAQSYNPAIHEAPIVVGHPKDNGPAFGWVQSVQLSADGLHASPKQVNPDFQELVKNGAYKKVSASFYPKNHPNSPTPGRWYLRHIGFLGAAAPAVKGLAGVSFSEADPVVFAEIDLLILREHAVRSRETALRRSEVETAVRQSLAAGVLPIGQFEGALAFAQALDAQETFDFSEGGQAVQAHQQQWFLDFLSKLPLPVVTGELAKGEVDFGEETFVTPSGYTASRLGLEIDRAATHHMKTAGGTYADAVRFAEKQFRR